MHTTGGLTINTRIIAQEFELHQADTLEGAVAWLSRHGGEARVLAGGTDLLVQMKLERVRVPRVLYLGKLDELRHIREDHRGVILGALVTFYELQRAPTIREQYMALHEAARAFTGTQIKVMGTIGGNLCNASPAADSAPPLLVFDARVTLVGAAGERQVRLEDFFLGPGQTVVQPSEILTEIHLPPPEVHQGSAFLKIGRVGADIAKVNAAARVVRDNDVVADCKIALGAVAPTPLRARQAESYLVGKRLDDVTADEAAQLAAQETAPITDVRSTATYRREIARVLVRDALRRAWDRSQSRGDS